MNENGGTIRKQLNSDSHILYAKIDLSYVMLRYQRNELVIVKKSKEGKMKKVFIFLFCIGLLLSGNAYAVLVPHCTDGDCEPTTLDCLKRGGTMICLNYMTDNEVTVCMSAQALSKVFLHRPNTCINTCAYNHNEGPLCNDNDF